MKQALFAVFACALLAVSVANAQAAANQAAAFEPCPAADTIKPVFDVVSVKPSDSPPTRSSMHGTPDGVMLTATLRRAILNAYRLHDFQLTGGPDWMSTQSWEIQGKMDTPAPDPGTLSPAERKQLEESRMLQLQAALIDRFHLRCHATEKEMPVYELVPAKGGAKLQEVTAEEDKRNALSTNGHGTQMHAVAKGITTEAMVNALSNEVGRIVVDKTGLTGHYNLTLDWVHDAAPGEGASADASSGPTIFTALEEQLGLKLVPAKGPVEVLVVDGAEKPVGN